MGSFYTGKQDTNTKSLSTHIRDELVQEMSYSSSRSIVTVVV